MGGLAQEDEVYFYIKINKTGINKIKLLNSRLLTKCCTCLVGDAVNFAGQVQLIIFLN